MEKKKSTYKKNTIQNSRKASKILSVASENYKKYLDIIGIMIIALNKKGEVSFANNRACEILGYKKEEILGKNWFNNFLPKKARKETKSGFDNIMKGKISTFEYVVNPVLTKKNKERLIEWHNSLIVNENRENVGTLSSGKDITELSKLNRELTESEEKFKMIFEDAPDGYYISDSMGNFIDGNKAAEKIVGYSKEELIGKNFVNTGLLDKKYMPQALKLLALSSAGMATGPDEFELIRKDGKKVFCEISTYMVKMHGKKMVLGIARDITERKSILKIIEEQNEYNLFNAEIWKLVSDKSLNEKQLIQKLMDKLGPSFGVSRACFNELQGDNFICTVEWKEPKVKPSLGMKLQRTMVEKLLTEDIIELNEKTALKLLPENMRAAAKPVIWAFVRTLNLEKVWIFPYWVYGKLEGAITFDINRDKKDKPELTEDKKRLIMEVAKIISESIARKRIEDMLMESEERFHALAQTAKYAIISFDDESNIIFWNAAAEKIFGYTASEVNEKHITTIIPDQAILIRHSVTKRNDDEENFSKESIFELNGRHKSGREIPLEISMSNWNTKQGIFFTSIVRDITTRKKDEEEIRTLFTAVEQNSSSIVITDKAGNIEYVNPKFSLLTGYSRQEAVGKNPRILKSGEIQAAGYKELWNTILSGREWRGEFHNKKKNGELYWENASISPIIDEKGKIAHFVAVKEDITEKKNAEQKLRESYDKLKELDVLKSNFLSMVSHELRTPLTSIKGFVSLMLGGVGGRLSDPQKEYMEIIKVSSERLLTLINDLLDISKMESGTFSLNLEKHDIVTIVDESIKTIFSIAAGKKIKITKDSDFVNLDLFIDDYRISQAMINLLNNAIKFSLPETEIVVGIKKIESNKIILPEELNEKLNSSQKYALIYVRDYGIGLEEENKQKLFSRFYQAEDIDTRKYGGTGLGLNISKSIIEMHGGVIWAESEGRNKGTWFKFLLPYE